MKINRKTLNVYDISLFRLDFGIIIMYNNQDIKTIINTINFFRGF